MIFFPKRVKMKC